MTSFVVSGTGTVAQTLTDGQNGFVTTFGTIDVETGNAVTMSGHSTLTVMGTLASDTGNAVALASTAVSTITVGQNGTILAGNFASSAISGAFATELDLRNAGLIEGGNGINLSSTTANSKFFLDNTGDLEGAGSSLGVAMVVALPTTGTATITNSGTIHEAASALAISFQSSGTLNLENSGTISVDALGGTALSASGALQLTNTGEITGSITDVSASASSFIRNEGTITGQIQLGNHGNRVENAGEIIGDVNLGNGNNSFTSLGGTIHGLVEGGTGNDNYTVDQSNMRITDTGGFDVIFTTVNFHMASGIEEMFLSGGTGLIGTGSETDNFIEGDVGDDTLLGLEGNDDLVGGAGNNLMRGGAGNDTFLGGDDNDQMFGGFGNDVLQVGLGDDGYFGGFGTDVLTLASVAGNATVNLGTGAVSFTNAGKITLGSIENVTGSEQNDAITGNGGDNVLNGLFSNDVLNGGAGNDTLQGSFGADTMNGGVGNDHFVYTDTFESNTANGIDLITGFQLVGDVIDLSPIDANTGSAGDDAFVFVGTAAFSGTGPQVRFAEDTVAGSTTIEVRLAGSTADDMVIHLGTALALTVANFEL